MWLLIKNAKNGHKTRNGNGYGYANGKGNGNGDGYGKGNGNGIFTTVFVTRLNVGKK